jgi:hypothetical protein
MFRAFHAAHHGLDRSLQRAQNWGVNAALLMLTLCMAAAHLM